MTFVSRLAFLAPLLSAAPGLAQEGVPLSASVDRAVEAAMAEGPADRREGTPREDAWRSIGGRETSNGAVPLLPSEWPDLDEIGATPEAENRGVPAEAERNPTNSTNGPDIPQAESYRVDARLLRDRGRRSNAVSTLSAGLSRAMSQDLLDLPEEQALTSGERLIPQASPDPIDRAAALDADNLSVTTGVEREMSPSTRPPPETTCPTADLVDVAGWGDGTADLRPPRTALLEEFDSPEPEAVLGLVRHYLYLGFGAEAVGVLRQFPQDGTHVEFYAGLARIMDERFAAAGPAFPAEDLTCGGPLAIWTLLANPGIRSVHDGIRTDIISSFSALPAHLRRHLGAPLVERFLEIGMTPTARSLWNAATRAPGDVPSDLALLADRMGRGTMAGGHGRQDLERLATSGEDIAPQALAALLTARLEEGGKIAPRWIEMAEALIYERRGTDIAARLRALEIRALGRNDAFSDALDRLRAADADSAIDDGTRSPVVLEIFDALAARAPDSAFAVAALSAERLLPDGAEADQVRDAIADRLLTLGLPGIASGVMDPGTSDLADVLRRSRRAILKADYGTARELLKDRPEGAAKELMAEVETRAGRHGEATRIYAELGESPAAADAAMRAGDWTRAARGRNDEIAPVLDRLSSPASTTAENPYERNREMISTSEAVRRDLTTLLENLRE